MVAVVQPSPHGSAVWPSAQKWPSGQGTQWVTLASSHPAEQAATRSQLAPANETTPNGGAGHAAHDASCVGAHGTRRMPMGHASAEHARHTPPVVAK